MNAKKKQSKCLYVWGENPLFNRLLSSNIGRIANAPVCIIDQTTLPLKEYLKDGDQHLFFCDCWHSDVPNVCRALRQLGQEYTEQLHFVLVNVKNSTPLGDEISRLNVDGVFFCHDGLEILHKGIQALLSGEIWFSREIMAQTLLCARNGNAQEIDAINLLTRREREILVNIAAGLSNQEIGDTLFISTNTVKTHVSNIYAKIEVPNRIQAILWASKYLMA